MALATTDPTAPRKLTPGAATLDPLAASPTGLAGTDAAPASPQVPGTANMNQMPGTASAITQLPDGVGGAVPVPPASMSPTYTPGAPDTQNGAVPQSMLVSPTASNVDMWAAFKRLNPGAFDASGAAINDAAGTTHTIGGGWDEMQRPGGAVTAGPVTGTTQAQYQAAHPDPFQAIHDASNQWYIDNNIPNPDLPGGASGPARPGLTPSSASDVRPSIPGAPGTQRPASGVTLPGSAPNGGGATMPSTFDANTNLINSQINPAASPRLLKTQGIADSALDKLTNGPDRAQLGKQYYDTFAQRAAANFGRGLTDATNRAAAHGQVGSGLLTNAYGDLAERFNLDNTTAASDFATKALEGTIGDNLNNFGAARNAENSQFAQDLSGRNEQRTERGYQQSLAEQAIARRIQQQQYEDSQQQQQFDNGRTLYGLGNANDPTGAYENAATLSSAEAGANSADVAALLKYFAQRRNPVPSGI